MPRRSLCAFLPTLMVMLMVMLIGGCATPAKSPEATVSVAEVSADVRVGAARSFEHCTWYPGAAGFSFSPRPVRPLGQLVLREDALLWGDYDMSKSVFQVARRIPFNQVKVVHLAQKAGRNLLVIESADGTLDSFAIEHPSKAGGPPRLEPDPTATADAWRFLRNLLGL